METYGIKFGSPQLYCHGLLGTQGWSPSSSICSEESNKCTSDCNDENVLQHGQVSVHFPVPPFRLQPVLPLSMSKSRAVSAMSAKDQALIQGFDTWDFQKDHIQESSLDGNQMGLCMGMEGLGIYTPVKAAKQSMRIELSDYPTQQIFSAPAPPAYLEILESFDDSPQQEPDEYPFPIMPYPLYSDDGLDEEKDKLQRLKDSLSLLQSDEMCDELCRESDSTSVIGQADTVPSEHQVPSLAEQMAFASGQGDSYSWCSPSKRRSSAAFYLPTSVQETPTSSQDERRMASRHVRQGVAANGSAPLPQSVSLHIAMAGQEAEVGSNWSHKGCDDESDGEVSDEEQYWLRVATPMDRSSLSLKSSSSLSSHLDLTLASLDNSPIMHGALSAHNFADQSSASGTDVETPSTCATSVQSIDLTKSDNQLHNNFAKLDDASDSTSPTTSADSPNSFYEFSFMLDESKHLYQSPDIEDQSFADRSLPGNVFSPDLDSFEMVNIPPAPSSSEELSDRVESRCPILPLSFSTSSILERPRPLGRTAIKTTFFGNVNMSQGMVKSKSATCFEEYRKPSTLPASSIKSLPEIPNRRSSLDAATLISSSQSDDTKTEKKKTHRRGLSVSFVESPSVISLPLTQAKEMVKISASNSTSRLSSKALNQVREACRAKAESIRSIGSDKEVDQVMTMMMMKKEEDRMQSSSRISCSSSPCRSCASPSMNSIVSDSDPVALPTLLIARTKSQRKRGWTGVEETEPQVLAMAKLGGRILKAIRQSKAEGLIHKPNLLQEGALLNMPHGVVLIVQEKCVVRESISLV